MKNLLIYLLEVLATSGVLMAAYSLLLERRVRFGWCRGWLLVSVIAALVIPALHIPVWPSEASAPLLTIGEATATTLPTVTVASTPRLALEWILAGIYLLGVGVMLGAMFRQMRHIHALYRSAKRTQGEGYTLAVTRERIASFSFFRTIYLWEGTPQEEWPSIIAHERSHIAHRHSWERLLMESCKMLLWWNPFVWIASRRLTEVEEFEADNDVLHAGIGVEEYMNAIFRQLFGYSPEIANGLRDSLTKKRFKMMTTNHSSRYALLRLMATLPVVLGLLCAFSFTAKADTPPSKQESKTITIQKNAPQGVSIEENGEQQEFTLEKIKKQGYALLVDGKWSEQLPEAEQIHSMFIEQITPERAEQLGIKGKKGMIIIHTKSAFERVIKQVDQIPDLQEGDFPKFQGGSLFDFQQWVAKEVRYPAEAVKAKIEGKVVVTFVVEKDGSIGEVTVVESPSPLLSNEVIATMKRSPKWTPASYDGNAVSIQFTLPISFQLPKE